MSERALSRASMWLVLGDGVSFMLITLVGFARHEDLSGASLMRLLATFLPFYAAWLMVLPWLGLHTVGGLTQGAILRRVLLGVLFAAPLGGFLRGLLLDAPILPVFVLVMGGVSAVTLLAWRLAARRLLGTSPPV